MERRNVDALVLGGGMAGLATAARLCQAGHSVVLVEKGASIGGSAQYAGFLWTAPSTDVMRRINPAGDPELSKSIVVGYDDAIAWVGELGVDMKSPVTVLGYGRGRETDVVGLLQACERIIREAGSEVLTQSTATRLIVDGERVIGAEIETSSGKVEISAAATVLATGGYAGDPELRAQRIGAAAEHLPLRANPSSRGDGWRLGTAVGAATALPNAGFYGHLIPSHVSYESPHEFTDLTFYHSEHGVLLNLKGERFCDETIGDHLNALSVLDQAEARALLVTDQRVHDEWMLRPYVEGVDALDKFSLAYRRGARCATADDLAEFRDLPEDWGYDGQAAFETLSDFNDRAIGKEHEPPRELDGAPLIDPPYYVIEVIPAITYTFEGLKVDPSCRVLNERGGAIPGLLAAGADAGGTYYRAYAGGLATALIQGLKVATTILDDSALSLVRSRETSVQFDHGAGW
jgi:succinate dehydrogenase/fumarate reductase flavoprotein subunit